MTIDEVFDAVKRQVLVRDTVSGDVGFAYAVEWPARGAGPVVSIRDAGGFFLQDCEGRDLRAVDAD